jgi:hypothetical protein
MIRAGMAITDAALDKEKRYEKELAAAKKELDHLHHLSKYYQYSTHEVLYMISDFKDTYAQFTNERNLFTNASPISKRILSWAWPLVKT